MRLFFSGFKVLDVVSYTAIASRCQNIEAPYTPPGKHKYPTGGANIIATGLSCPRFGLGNNGHAVLDSPPQQHLYWVWYMVRRGRGCMDHLEKKWHRVGPASLVLAI